MEMNTTFTVTTKCRLLEEKTENESYNDVDLELTLTKEDAMKFLFKFTPFIFTLSDGRQIVMKIDGYECKITAMIIIDKEHEASYIVLHPQMLWTEILEAYDQLRLFDKIQVMSSIHVPEIEDSEEE